MKKQYQNHRSLRYIHMNNLLLMVMKHTSSIKISKKMIQLACAIHQPQLVYRKESSTPTVESSYTVWSRVLPILSPFQKRIGFYLSSRCSMPTLGDCLLQRPGSVQLKYFPGQA